MKKIPGQNIQNIRERMVKSEDGADFYVCFEGPRGEGPYPAVIFIHGGFGENREYARAMLDWSVAGLLVEEGFVVLSTDYRVDHTGKDIGDVVAAFQFAAGLPFVDEQKIAYFGDSHGAYLAIMAATQTHPYALIHGWGVADMAEWYGHIKDLPISYYKKITEDFTRSMGGTPDQVPEKYRQVSPTSHVSRIECPVLILHGAEDKEVPVAHAHTLAEAIEKAGGEYKLKIFKKAGHGLRSPEIRKTMDPLVLDFLNRYL